MAMECDTIGIGKYFRIYSIQDPRGKFIYGRSRLEWNYLHFVYLFRRLVFTIALP